ncbi:MAG: hypothetical protein ACLSCU_10050 [Eubacterium sp.]
MKNRILSVLLALCMVICMAPATALASGDDSVMDMKVTELIGDRTNALSVLGHTMELNRVLSVEFLR